MSFANCIFASDRELITYLKLNCSLLHLQNFITLVLLINGLKRNIQLSLANIKMLKIQKIITLFLILLRLSSYSQSTNYKYSIDIENDTNQRYGDQMKTWELSRINKHQKALLLWDKDKDQNSSPSIRLRLLQVNTIINLCIC